MNIYKLLIFIFLTTISFEYKIFPDPVKNKKYEGRDAVILCFHDINGEGKYSITEDEFKEILNLISGKYEVYSLKNWYFKIKNKESFNKRPLIMTFDDGYESIFKIVIPELKKRSFGATFFFYLNRYSDSSSVYRIISKLDPLFEIGCHSFSHANMLKLYENNPDKFFKEIFLSRKKLGYLTGKDIVSWAWPYGYYNPEMEKMAKYAGYEIQVNTDYKTTENEWGEASFSRFTVQNPDPVNQVKEILEKNHNH